MLSGVVPIYWGAPDVFEFIPREAIVSFPDFKNMNALYSFLSQMEEKEWLSYVTAADDFLKDSRKDIFSPEYFSDSLVREML